MFHFYEPAKGHGLPHNPLKALVSPRPIAWVSSLSADGTPNLAPYSFFNAVNEDPPIVIISCSTAPDRAEKDTLANIVATREFVVHIVPQALGEAMNISSAPHPAEIDEFEAAGLAKAPSTLVAPPRIADAPVAMECRYHLSQKMPGSAGYTVVFGEVVGIHIAEAVLENGLVNVEKYAPLSRLGYMDYAAVKETFSMKRPTA